MRSWKARFAPIDAVLIGALLLFAFELVAAGGSKRGAELMPWPDGLEYAAAAVNIHDGRGPVLHFGDNSYPSRYTAGYPLMLALAYPIVGRNVANLYRVTTATGMLAIAMLYILTLWIFGRVSAFFASLLLATSPLFLTYSTLVMSDVPSLALTLAVALAFFKATEAEGAPGAGRSLLGWWAVVGLLAGFTVMVRPTNLAIAGGIVMALLMVPVLSDSRLTTRIVAAVGVGAIAFLVPVLWQAHENILHLGSATASGYVFWVPEVYGSLSRTFNPAYLFGPTMPRNPYGNVPAYGAAILGLDGLLVGAHGPRFNLYSFATAIFALIGLIAVFRSPGDRVRKRVVWFGIGFLLALFSIYLLYAFTEIAFILPAAFILYACAGFGLHQAHRRVRSAWDGGVKSTGRRVRFAGLVSLDIVMALSIVAVSYGRLAVPAPKSRIVAALGRLDRMLEPRAIIVSNVALQFLELYLGDRERRLIGLNSLDPGGRFTDYHLHRLYVRHDRGAEVPLPSVLVREGRIDRRVADELVQSARAGRPVYLLIARAEFPDYARVLEDELGQVKDFFSFRIVKNYGAVVLLKIAPR